MAGARRHTDLLLGAWQHHVPHRALKEQGLGNPSLAAAAAVLLDQASDTPMTGPHGHAGRK